MKIGDILADVKSEYLNATAQYEKFNSAHEGLAVLEEEFEELKQEVFKKPSIRSRSEMRLEALQVAAMAVRFINDVCAQQQPHKTTLVISDGDAAPIVYNTMAGVLAIIGALAAGSVWTKVWEMTVGAQQTYRWGYGSPAQPHNQGYMWFASLLEGTGFETGKLRLVENNANESRPQLCLEIDDTRLHTADATTLITATPGNINEMLALPEKVEFPQVGEDSKLQIWYRCIAIPGAEDAVGFSIPATHRL